MSSALKRRVHKYKRRVVGGALNVTLVVMSCRLPNIVNVFSARKVVLIYQSSAKQTKMKSRLVDEVRLFSSHLARLHLKNLVNNNQPEPFATRQKSSVSKAEK